MVLSLIESDLMNGSNPLQAFSFGGAPSPESLRESSVCPSFSCR